MPTIDIVTMRGETPRVAPHLLPNEVATLARDCLFDRGTLQPLNDDLAMGVTLPITPKTLFRYTDNFWFAWAVEVEAIRSPIAQDSYGRVYYTDGDYPKVTTADIATGGATKPTAWYRLGVSAPTSAIQIGEITPPDGATDDDATDDETRYYVHTYVTASGEEGPPSDASTEVTITIPDSTVTLGLPAVDANDRNITSRRIYRSVTSDDSADYLFVAEVPIAQASYVDSKASDELAGSLETYDYLPPPDNMRGLCLMANGIACGFAGNELLFSGAYLPYAWPEANRLTTEHEIVAIAATGAALVVGTEGYPYLCQGVSPSAITSTKIELQQACISRRSMVSVDGLVLYASPDGLVGVSTSGANLVTVQIITPSQWQVMNPETLRAWCHEGKYIGITDTHAFMYDPASGDFRQMSNRWDAAYEDLLTDSLYVAHGTQLSRWRGDSEASVNYTWRSKVFTFTEAAMSCAKVSRGDGDLTFRLYLDGELVLDLDDVPTGAFRLPSLRGNKWQVEVSGLAEVERIQVATSMAEIQ
ncbi:hypothetical protein [Pseudaeromonas paramecii]|uniref:Uncharacterized protein n=1 Tax=Pseudaeromonas paramecii TaxID=2138166 RepID=A0ABP8PVE5_9GAMM